MCVARAALLIACDGQIGARGRAARPSHGPSAPHPRHPPRTDPVQRSCAADRRSIVLLDLAAPRRAQPSGAAARDKAEPRTALVQRSRAAPSAASRGCRQPGQLYQLVGSRWRRSIPLAARLCAEAVAAKQRAAPQFAASQPAQRSPGRRHGCARLYRRLQRQAVPCGGPRCTFCVCCALRRVLCFGTVSSMTDWSALAS